MLQTQCVLERLLLLFLQSGCVLHPRLRGAVPTVCSTKKSSNKYKRDRAVQDQEGPNILILALISSSRNVPLPTNSSGGFATITVSNQGATCSSVEGDTHRFLFIVSLLFLPDGCSLLPLLLLQLAVLFLLELQFVLLFSLNICASLKFLC